MTDPNGDEWFASTGRLPPRTRVSELVHEAYSTFRDLDAGANSTVYPALSAMEPDLFAISMVSADATSWSVGDSDVGFTMMSVAKPFVFALVCEEIGPERARAAIGANATGLPFNSLEALDRVPDGTTNPMVNPGAIATTSLASGDSAEDRWQWISSGLSRFAARDLGLDEMTFQSASATNHRNREIVTRLAELGAVHCDPLLALDLYTRQSCLTVTVDDLAVMGATLADGGVNPRTGERIVSPTTCHHTLAVMATAGLYETSGDWLYEVGLPAKSGISGGIVTVSPGKGGLGTFSPRLDEFGNSVRGQRVAGFLSRRLGLDLFVSHPVRAD